MLKKAVRSDKIREGGTSFSRALLVEGKKLLFISGEGPFDLEGNLIGKGGDMEAQARQTFKNIEAALEAAGADFSNVVKLTIFVTDMSKTAGFSKARSEFIVPDYPAATLVGVASLGNDEMLLEVDAIAVLD